MCMTMMDWNTLQKPTEFGDKMKKDIFELEQEILHCWHITNDLRDVSEMFLEGYKVTTPDNISNVCSALADVYNMRFEKMWRNFENITSEYWQMKKKLEKLKLDNIEK